MMTISLNVLFNAEKLFSRLVRSGFVVVVLFISVISLTTTTSAQIPPGPSPSINNNLPPTTTTNTTSSTTTPSPTIEITSHEDGQEVPAGELTIEGISSDDGETNCQVYSDVNDIKPLQNVTATGPGGANDYSNWTFTYTKDYHLITEGVNELTTKISCFDGSGPTPMSKWYSVNVTGVTTAPDSFVAPAPLP